MDIETPHDDNSAQSSNSKAIETSSHNNNHIPIPSNRSFYYGNWTLWLILGSAIGLWFTIGGPIAYIHKHLAPGGKGLGGSSMIHVIPACFITWICIWNIFHTPDHGPLYRKIHKRLGWVSVIFAYVVAITGVSLAWFERYNPDERGRSIGLIFGGIGLVVTSSIGIWFLRWSNKTRAEAIKSHSGVMTIGFFFSTCLIPALIRLPELMQLADPPGWLIYCWIIPFVMGILCIRAMRKKSFI